MLFLKPTFCIPAFALQGDAERQLCSNWKRPHHVALVPRGCGAGAERGPDRPSRSGTRSVRPGRSQQRPLPAAASAAGCSIGHSPTIHKKGVPQHWKATLRCWKPSKSEHHSVVFHPKIYIQLYLKLVCLVIIAPQRPLPSHALNYVRFN